MGMKIWVSTWSHLSILHPLKIPIPMCIMYCTLSIEVKPKTISRLNQKTDITAQPKKKLISGTNRAENLQIILLKGNLPKPGNPY
jgi:hypothetical protein